jgi:hypothetical protein
MDSITLKSHLTFVEGCKINYPLRCPWTWYVIYLFTFEVSSDPGSKLMGIYLFYYYYSNYLFSVFINRYSIQFIGIVDGTLIVTNWLNVQRTGEDNLKEPSFCLKAPPATPPPASPGSTSPVASASLGLFYL